MNSALKIFHRLSLATLLITMSMVVLGGVVHNTGSSLACPDWPLCFGQVFPKMEGGVAVEHSHRLLGMLIGLLCIALVVVSRRIKQTDPCLARTAIGVLVAVILQGVLGGATVLLKLSPLVSTLHLGTSQLVIALLLWITVRSAAKPDLKITTQPSKAVYKALGGATVLIYLQMLLGAGIRHGGAAQICGLGPDSPNFLCLDPVTQTAVLFPSTLAAKANLLHRYFGIVAGLLAIGGTIPMLKWAKSQGIGQLRAACVGTHIIVVTQWILGFLTLATYIGVVSTTLHLLFAMLLWMTLLFLNFRSREITRVCV